MLSFFKNYVFVYGTLGLRTVCGLSLSAVSRAALRCSVRASHVVLSLAAEAVTSVTTAQAVSTRASVGVACGLSYPAACGILVPDQGLNPSPLLWQVNS